MKEGTMNDPYEVADALGITLEELTTMLRNEAAISLRVMADTVSTATMVPDTKHLTQVLGLIEACEEAGARRWIEETEEMEGGGGSATSSSTSKEATSAQAEGLMDTAATNDTNGT